jgi:hypothetical protein
MTEGSFGSDARDVMHVAQELSFTGEPTVDICLFLGSSVPRDAVDAIDFQPRSLAWSLKLTECILVYMCIMFT